MKLPTFAQWKHFFKIISLKEKIAFFGLTALAAASGTTLAVSLYKNGTVIVPSSNGAYIEGVMERPRFLNPIYANSNGVDQDITQLLFSSLLDYDESGQIVSSLADYKISDDGKTYEFALKNGLRWSDGAPITSDDAIYTIKTIQDPAYNSPLRARWFGVETEKVSDNVFRFKLTAAYAPFLENCVIKIIPKHAWETLSPENFALSPLNLEPIVSGPYRIKSKTLAKDGAVAAVNLERNPYYVGIKPHLALVTFAFYPDHDSLTAALKRNHIHGFVPPSNDADYLPGTSVYSYEFPRYYAIFLNSQNNKALEDPQARAALTYATDKQEILNNALNGLGKIVNSPTINDIYSIEPPTTAYGYDPQKAAQMLDDAGYAIGSDGIRAKTVSRQHAFEFAKDLKPGTNLSGDVKELQKCLAKEVMPDLDTNGNYGEKTIEAVNLFQEKYRVDILDPQKIEKPTGDVKLGTREKLNAVCFPSGDTTIPLNIVLTIADREPFTKVAQIIKSQWAKIGVAVTINPIGTASLERDAVKPRNYQALLYGQGLAMIPDPYPFWHSTQKIDPGLNFSLYENKDADKLLEEIRQTSDQNFRAEKLKSLQNLILKDEPAIFLYNPDYAYIVSNNVKGIKGGVITESGRRFANIADWFTATKRIWK